MWQLWTDILKEAIIKVRPINNSNGKSDIFGIFKGKKALKEKLFLKKWEKSTPKHIYVSLLRPNWYVLTPEVDKLEAELGQGT